MSSNIKQKTTPPGSWPCPKGSGGGETREAEQHKAATPRSPPAAPEGLSFFERDGTGGSSVDYSQSGGEYTHRNPEAKGEGRKEEKEEGEKKEGPIEMKDESGGKEEEGEWKEAEPKPVEEEKVGKEEEGKEKGEEKETETVKASDDVEAAAGETGEGGQSLTDDAKREFDQAPENQRTDEARDEFIKTAKGNLASSQEEAGKEDVQELEVEEPEKSEAALQEKLAEEEENKPVEGKTTPEDQKATTETQEQPSEEQPSTNEAEKPTDTEEPAPEQEEEDQKVDFSILKNGTVNKGGYVINPDKKLVGRVIQGPLQHLVGKKVDENGTIWDNTGKEAGKAEPIPENERDELLKEPAPFESFPDAVVSGDGFVTNGPNGEKVGKVVEGNLKELRNKSVDADGDILDRGGNVIGKAERWEPEPEKEPEPEPEVDKSILAGKRVNKAGNVVDSHGTIYGRVVEGDVKKMVGRMCNKKGEVLSESGDKLGLAELVPEGERESPKEGPFADLEGCTVAKDGTVVLPSGTIVGRLLSGDPKVLFNRPVDEDGDILDKAGNAVGKAERWEPEPEPEKKKNPMSGRKVSKEGDVRDEDGNVIGKLTSGDVQVAAGKEVDDDGDVVNYKGNVVGHCSLLEDIPEEKPEETPEEREKREQAEKDKKLAQQMAACIEQCLDSIRPICKMITEVRRLLSHFQQPLLT